MLPVMMQRVCVCVRVCLYECALLLNTEHMVVDFLYLRSSDATASPTY